jgi:tetratricopeptide (TPR) repeat protein
MNCCKKRILLPLLVSWLPLLQGAAQSTLTLPYADHLFQRGEYYRAISVYDQYLFLDARNREDTSYCAIQIMKCYFLGQEYKDAVGFGESYLTSLGVNESTRNELSRYVGLSYLKMGYPKSAMLYFNGTEGIPRLRLLNGICNLYLYEWDKADEQFTHAVNTIDSMTSASGEDLSRIALNGKKLSRRSPVVAGVLSTLLPGAGYAYTGNYQTGFFSLALNALLLGSAYELHRHNLKFSGTFFFLIGFGWYIGNIYGSYTSAVKYNESIRRDYVDESLQRFDYLMK